MTRMRNLLPLIAPAIAAFMFAPAPLAAQTAGASARVAQAENDIVVEGRREEIRNELKQLFEEKSDQLARFESEFCPVIIGFPADWSAIIEQKVRENVTEAGMEVEDKPCRPTASVIFTYDPELLMEGLRKKMPGLFSGMSPVEIDRLTGETRTAYGWRAVDMLSRDGKPLDNASQVNGEASSAKIVRNAYPTRLYSNVRYDIVNSYLVLDIDRTPGMTLQQIADFATLHLLLDLQLDAGAKARDGSILKLFDVADPSTLPDTMSGFDRRMLKGFYAQPENNFSARRQRSRIAREIKSEDDGEE